MPFAGYAIRKACVLSSEKLRTRLWDLEFSNPVGLAAGFDKNAEYVNEFTNLGFGFIEIGTITPKPQPGNPKPRLFRLVNDQAIINRMGFNNQGVEAAVNHLKKTGKKIIIGGNIGKNKFTPNHLAGEDYLVCFEELYDYVDYFVVNVSSPNTPDLRELQGKEPLVNILNLLIEARKTKTVKKPLLVKIAPDLSKEQLDDIIDIANDLEIDGIVATNTTISRNGLKYQQTKVDRIGDGGLSGLPLRERSTEIIRYLRNGLKDQIKIIGVGGIMSPQDCIEKLNAGASLIQIYTGFIYEGPGFVKRLNKMILKERNIANGNNSD